MRLLASESYNIAWFKLADFVARGEKERALNVHRLLMHSIEDQALPYQLEGDILLAFDDDAALDRYHMAANLYKKTGKIQQAISVYQHVCMFKEDEKILESLLDIYLSIKNKLGILDIFSRFAKVCLQKNNVGSLINLFHRYLAESDKLMQALLNARLVISLLLYDKTNNQISFYMQQSLDLLKELHQEKELQKFLSEIKFLNNIEYKKAEQYLVKNF